MAGTATLIGLLELRARAAAALAPAGDSDPPVFADAVDSLVPPALMLDWDDPWLEPGAGLTTLGPCLWTARLVVICIAGRLEPGSGVDVLEQLVVHVVTRLKADPYSWPLEGVSAPLQRDLGGVSYLAANVTYAVPVTV